MLYEKRMLSIPRGLSNQIAPNPKHTGPSVGMARRRLLSALVAWGGAATLGVSRAGDVPMHDHSGHKKQMSGNGATGFLRSQVRYVIPALAMVDQRGRKVEINKALADGRPVILNFVFTSCTTICPVMTQIFSQVQDALAGQLDRVHMVSISVDPQQDTPARLLAYSKEHGAGSQWDFYTGTIEASVALQKAFDAYRGDKMNQEPLTLLRGPRGNNWVRLDGFASPEAIVSEYRATAG